MAKRRITRPSGAKRTTIQHTVHKGNGANHGRKCSARQPNTALALSSSIERLDYIAAMVQELKMMSAQADCRTLTSLLELAYHEALQRRRTRE